MSRWIHRPSPAMIVACLALLVALTGTSVAAVSQLVPRNSVGPNQLRTGAVTRPKLRNNAVDTTKVANRSLRAVDFAAGQLPAGPQGPQGPAGPAGTGATLAFGSATGANATATSSTTFVELPGASASVTVPTGATATLFVSFSAESLCTGPSGYCPVRVLVDGNEAAPVVGNDFAFDSTDMGTETTQSWESHAIERVVTGLAAGSHTVTVQYAVTAATTTLRLDDWGLTAVAMRQS
jgi:hypothetical protein